MKMTSSGEAISRARVKACHFREMWCGNGARLRRGRKNHCRCSVKKKAGNFVDGFVAHGPVNQDDVPAGQELLPEHGNLPSASGVVRAVDINFRPAADSL